jgi:hypothetical protein
MSEEGHLVATTSVRREWHKLSANHEGVGLFSSSRHSGEREELIMLVIESGHYAAGSLGKQSSDSEVIPNPMEHMVITSMSL